MPDLRLLYFGQVIVVIDCRCFNHSCMACVTSKSDFQNKDRFENLSCNQCYPYSTIGNIVLAFAKVSYIHAGHLHNANCDCCNLGNIWNFPQVQEKYVESIWFCLLVLIPVPIAITHISDYFLPQVQFDFTSDIFNSGITLALSLVCFGVDYLLYHRKGDAADEQ